MHQASTLFAVAALVSSVVLLLLSTQRLIAIVAVIASSLEVALNFHVIRISIGNFPISIALGATLAVVGCILWLAADRKIVISAATVVALVGIAQVVSTISF
ncbi:MAG: hypothetical protein JW841_05260 [Deltaproteobacteria bacterium]|nr:hypothetical protein [Deltaproteobacteria bacterium]